MTTPVSPKHDQSTHADGETCDMCLVPPPRSKSAMIAWTVAGVATTLLILVFFLGVGSRPSTLLAGGGLALLGVLLCPLAMGGMMWMMMRKGH